jgi:SAM-dependent methyltransferase
VTRYRYRILEKIRELVKPLGPIKTVLDFGAGDGFFASQWKNEMAVKSVTAVDVVERKTSFVVPTLYDGERLPFADQSFDLAYAVDVLHHCNDPPVAINDLARCSRQYLLIKDHTYQGRIGKFTLGILDEIGNRRFGIPSPQQYQRGWEWVEQIESKDWRRLSLMHPLPCHSGVLGAVTNGLQFVGLWERVGA